MSQIDIHFYDHPCWEGRSIRRITGTGFTHVVPCIGTAGFHIDRRTSRWVDINALHRVMPPKVTVSTSVPTCPIDLIEQMTEGLSMDVVDLSAWYRNRQQGLIRPMPDCCVSVVRDILALCGVRVDEGTPDELYEQLRRRESPAVPHHP